MTSPGSFDRRAPRVGIYGWGVVAPGASNIVALEQLLRGGGSALSPSSRSELGPGLFAVGDPDFSFDDYAPWIAQRHGEAYVARLRSKMGDNVQFAVGVTIQALQGEPRLEAMLREGDEGCPVFIGSGVGDLRESHRAAEALDRATRIWNHFWAQPAQCAERQRFEADRPQPAAGVPIDPRSLPIDSLERFDAVV